MERRLAADAAIYSRDQSKSSLTKKVAIGLSALLSFARCREVGMRIIFFVNILLMSLISCSTDSSAQSDAVREFLQKLSTQSLRLIPSSLSDRASIDCAGVFKKRGSRVAQILCSGRDGASADWDVNSAEWAIAGGQDIVQKKLNVNEQDGWRRWLNKTCPLQADATMVTPDERICVFKAFHDRARSLRSRLSGDALAEAMLTPEQHAKVQEGLIGRGLLQGKADGEFGDTTRQAIKQFQSAEGSTESGFLTKSEYIRLLANNQSPPSNVRSADQRLIEAEARAKAAEERAVAAEARILPSKEGHETTQATTTASSDSSPSAPSVATNRGELASLFRMGKIPFPCVRINLIGQGLNTRDSDKQVTACALMLDEIKGLEQQMISYGSEKKWDEAIGVSDRLIEKNPQSAAYYHSRCWYNAGKQQPDGKFKAEAILRDCSLAIQFHSSSKFENFYVDDFIMRGNAYGFLGNLESSELDFQQALKLDASSEGAKQGLLKAQQSLQERDKSKASERDRAIASISLRTACSEADVLRGLNLVVAQYFVQAMGAGAGPLANNLTLKKMSEFTIGYDTITVDKVDGATNTTFCSVDITAINLGGVSRSSYKVQPSSSGRALVTLLRGP
jgi:tetratricopeptide (TPR) repeat protein